MQLKQFPDKQTFQKLYPAHSVVPLCREILADRDTPVSVLEKTYDPDGVALLLESVEGGERWGRYSFLSTSARAHVKVFRDVVEISKNGRIERIDHGKKPFRLLRDFMDRYRAARVPGLPRFWGGLVGYVTYEAVSFVEEIPHQWPVEKPLAHFVMPDEVLIFDNVRNTLQIIVLCFSRESAAKDADPAYEEALSRIDRIEAEIVRPFSAAGGAPGQKPLALEPVYEDADFRRRVEKIIECITAGEVIQTVLSQPFVSDAPQDLIALYRAQRYINPSPYLFFLRLGGMALIGSSPETLVRLENGVATLRPIAGTRPRGKTESEDRALADELLRDEKERAEHLMLVDLGRNDLGRVARTGSVQVTDLMFIERYSHVMHMVSNITCDLEEQVDAWDLLCASFPAGTLSGAPKVRAMELIAETEDSPRGPYGGAVGYISYSGNMDLAITIRTAMVEEGRLTVNAGAGIVYDSDPEKERIETVNKAMAIERALQLATRKGGGEMK
jgi:anthranilate synthase component 1